MNQIPLWDLPPAGRATVRPLSKSRIMGGLQCLKRVYLETYESERQDEIDPGRRAILESGRNVGRMARRRWPGGTVAEEDPRRHDQAVRQTAEALQDPRTRAIYEAAFTHDEIRVRADILARNGGSAWDLIEVKSSTGYKEEYLSDVAVQLHVIAGSGVPIQSASLLHINNQYVWPGGEYDLERLFSRVDLTGEARAAGPALLTRIAAMRGVLAGAQAPDVPIGPQCRKPYVCPFHGYCHAGQPEHHVRTLPRLSPKVYRALLAAEIEDIRDIPEDFDGLSELQRRVRDCVVKGVPFEHPDLKPQLETLQYPIHFLDFETCAPAIPIVPGTRPFEQIPFQWSLHVLARDGTLNHLGYLHEDRTDPRQPLASALLEALGDAGSIVVYSGFEGRVVRALATTNPGLAPRLLPLADERMVDLHQLIHAHYYHPDFKGSFSIKDVLPVLVEGLDYSDLSISTGSQAAIAFEEMTDPETPGAGSRAIRDGLWAYCRRDTEAMVRLFQTLKEDS